MTQYIGEEVLRKPIGRFRNEDILGDEGPGHGTITTEYGRETEEEEALRMSENVAALLLCLGRQKAFERAELARLSATQSATEAA